MVEFTKETNQVWCFLLWKLTHFWFIFFSRYQPTYSISFSLCKFGNLCLSKNRPISFSLSNLWSCLQYSFIILLMSMGPIVMIPLSFHYWWFISLFFSWSTRLEDYQLSWSLQKNLVFSFIDIFPPIFNLFWISALFLLIYFLIFIIIFPLF